ncbi:MAG: ATP-binding protein [Bifidobacteriaceae bacterium]|jgi:predicted AAA+ superfamily ATPase|nr:ATP-binding protein [Bifidobacteriaceae bacterium]
MLEEIPARTVLRREALLARLRPLYDDYDLVKVLTGVRRCGKSVLLHQVAEELRSRSGPERVIELDFEVADLAQIRNHVDLDRYVMSRVRDAGQLHYVLLDEVQEVDGFEKGVNSLRARGNISVFITGSNAHVLSGELATYLAGRYRELRVWPLSYAEAVELRALHGLEGGDQLADYLRWGGLPHRFGLPESEVGGYLRDIFSSVVLRDVVQRTGIRDVVGLETIVDFACENLGRVMSPTSASAYLKSQRRSIATETIYSYLHALDAALLLNRVRRYDVRGKRVMATLDKYYATDVGLLASRRVGQGPGLGDLVENAVYTHLAGRGFEVYTGKTPTGEIDFVAVKDGRPRYVQVAYLLADEAVAAREFGAFAPLRDGYPRFLITLDPLTQDRDGVTHLKLEDFLLHPPVELA